MSDHRNEANTSTGSDFPELDAVVDRILGTTSGGSNGVAGPGALDDLFNNSSRNTGASDNHRDSSRRQVQAGGMHGSAVVTGSNQRGARNTNYHSSNSNYQNHNGHDDDDDDDENEGIDILVDRLLSQGARGDYGGGNNRNNDNRRGEGRNEFAMQQHHREQQQEGGGGKGITNPSVSSSQRQQWHPHGASSSQSSRQTRPNSNHDKKRSKNDNTAASTAASITGASVGPMLRRFELWEERRGARKLQAVYQALLQEAEEFTFFPDTSDPDAVLSGGGGGAGGTGGGAGGGRSNNTTTNRMTRKDSSSSSNHGGDAYDGGHGEENDSPRHSSRYNSHHQPQQQPQHPKGTEAFLDRLAVARQEKERVRRAEEAAVRRRLDRSTFSRGPTQQAPFDLSCYHYNSNSNSMRQTTPPPLPRPHSTTSIPRGHRNSGTREPIDNMNDNSTATAVAVAVGDASSSSPYRHHHRHFYAAAAAAAAAASSPPHHQQQQQQQQQRQPSSSRVVGTSTARRHLDAAGTYASPGLYRREQQDDTFNTIGPVIRQQILFSEKTTRELQRATSSVKQCFQD